MDNKYPSVSAFTTEGKCRRPAIWPVNRFVFNVTFHEKYLGERQSGNLTVPTAVFAVYTKMTNSDTNAAAFIYTVAAGDTNTSALAITAINFNGIVDKVNQSATNDGSYTTNRYKQFF